MKTDINFWSYFAHSFLQWEMFRTNVVQEIKTHVFCLVTFFRKSCYLWDNVGKYCRVRQATGDTIIWRMRVACWIIKATDTHTICNTYYFSTATMVARTRLNVTLHVHCLSCLRSTYSTSWRLRYMIQHIHSDPKHFAPRYAPQTLTHSATNQQFPLPTATKIIWLCINRISLWKKCLNHTQTVSF